MISFGIFLMMLVESAPIYKRAGVGFSASGVRMTYYGADYQKVGDAYIGDVPPYKPYGIGACGQEPIDKNFFVAMNTNAFDGSCGFCAKITRGDACVVAPIVDKCPGCGAGLDLSIQAYGMLVGGEAEARRLGVTNVDFEIVVCPQNKASTGSPFTSNTDPCSGSNSGSISSSNSTTFSLVADTAIVATTTSSLVADTAIVATTTSSLVTDTAIVATTTTSNIASVTLSSNQITCSANGTLFGFKCCQNPPNPDWKDKNGYLYGWENGQACIEPK